MDITGETTLYLVWGLWILRECITWMSGANLWNAKQHLGFFFFFWHCFFKLLYFEFLKVSLTQKEYWIFELRYQPLVLYVIISFWPLLWSEKRYHSSVWQWGSHLFPGPKFLPCSLDPNFSCDKSRGLNCMISWGHFELWHRPLFLQPGLFWSFAL